MSDLRKRLRAQRAALSPAARQAANHRICRQVCDSLWLRDAKRVAAYLSFDGEVDPTAIIQHLHHRGERVYLPILQKKKNALPQPMRFAPYGAGDTLRKNQFGILEPTVAAECYIEPDALDLVLTPLVGFDERCIRLGMGGGYYDRSFAFLHTRPGGETQPGPYLLGLAFELQKLSQLPSQAWDIPLDAVVTEAGVYQRK